MEKMTIHRGLSELKLIGSKIETQTNNLIPSGIMQKDKLVNGTTKQEDFEKSAKERYQSVIDLITRGNKIKSAIVKANGETDVKIGTETMKIADAINIKTVLGYKKNLIALMEKRHTQTKANLEKNNAQIDTNALKLAEVALGKQGIKIGEDDAQKVIGPFLEANKFSLIDPLQVERVIEELSKGVLDFESEVDAALSEINAVTFIEF